MRTPYWIETIFRQLRRLEVRVATALGKERPVLIVANDFACQGQETIVAAPIRTKPPPFPCPGLLAIDQLADHGDLRGYIRLDLLIVYERNAFSTKVVHFFSHRDDVARINDELKAALGLT